MDLFEANSILLFIVFFIPGFISMKVFNLLIASERINFSQSISEAIAFSSINYAALSWLIVLIHKYNLINTKPYFFVFLATIIIFIAPILWSFVFVQLAKSKKLGKFIISPIKNPWDYFFEQRKSCWVIVRLKSGEKIGGLYSSKSFASANPHKEQIYLEKTWEIESETENFIKEIPNSKGILILRDEIVSVEFFSNQTTDENV